MKRTLAWMIPGALLLAAPLGAQGKMVGKPVLFTEYFPEWRCFPAMLQDERGNLLCGGNRVNQEGATRAPAAAGPVSACTMKAKGPSFPRTRFAYVDPEGRVVDLYYTRIRERDTWFFQILNMSGRTDAPKAAGNPGGMEFKDDYHVVFRDAGGGLHDLVCAASGEWRSQQLNNGGQTGAPPAAGDPSFAIQGDLYHILYRDQAGGVQDIWFDGHWHAQQLNLGECSDAPPAAGDPAGTCVDGRLHVTYVDSEGNLQDLAREEDDAEEEDEDQDWDYQTLNNGGLTRAPRSAGNPAPTVLEGHYLHVAYRTEDGKVFDIWYDGSWHALQVNHGGATDAPMAASDPATLVPPSNWQYIAYVDVNGNAQLLSHCKRAEWTAARLNCEPARSRLVEETPEEGKGAVERKEGEEKTP